MLELAGWGNYPTLRCDWKQPEAPSQIGGLLERKGTIPRGLGRSYGDPAILAPGRVLAMPRMDRLLAFNEETGVLTCESGTSLETVIAQLGPLGFFPAVTPGTKYVTVGGCLANDVHGKAHHADGCFSEHVDSFEILLADRTIRHVTKQSDPELFWATAGGLGLTGVIVTVTFRLRKVETTYFKEKSIIVKDLEALLSAIEEHDQHHPYSVAWIDPLKTGKQLGKGVLKLGDHATLSDLSPTQRKNPLKISPPPSLTLPVMLPNFTLNSLTLRALNVGFKHMLSRNKAVSHYEQFFYPLDMIKNWNRGYGRRGFTQYQFAIPLEDGLARMTRLLEKIAGSGFLPFLNVLKKFGKQGDGMLSFPFEGWTFAIDFPIARGLDRLLQELDDEVMDAGGRIYLGKDAFLKASSLPRMFPRLEEWKEVKRRVDPEGVFRSALSQRVGLTG